MGLKILSGWHKTVFERAVSPFDQNVCFIRFSSTLSMTIIMTTRTTMTIIITTRTTVAIIMTTRTTMKRPTTTTGYFRKVYRGLQVRVPHNILKYLSIQKLPQKRFHQSVYPSNSHKRIFILVLCFNFITNINICKYKLKNIFK